MDKIYGRHAVKAAFIKRPKDIKRVVILHGTKPHLNKDYLDWAYKLGLKPEMLSFKQFKAETGLSDDDSHQGICIFISNRRIYIESELDKLTNANLVLALDQVSNPRNMATILRSAAFFNVDAVLYLKNRPVEIDQEVTQMAVGGAEFVDLYEITNLSRSLEKLKEIGFWIYGMDDSAASDIYETEFDKKSVIVVGAENEGLRHKTKENCDFLIKVSGGKEGIECLNASVAASVALAIYRSKNLKISARIIKSV